MNEILREYKRMLLLYKARGRSISLPQKRVLVRRIVVLERLIVRSLIKQFSTGAFQLNLSKFPPRLRIILQRILNRRLHIIHFLERKRKEAEFERKRKENEMRELSSFTMRLNKEIGALNVSRNFFSTHEHKNRIKSELENAKKI